MTMVELMSSAIKIIDGILVEYPQYGVREQTSYARITSDPGLNKKFDSNNGTLAFVQDGVLYVTPWTREASRTLVDAGFVEGCFCVPFSNWDYPVKEKAQWDKLLAEQEAAMRRYYQEDCMEWCMEHGVAPLAPEVLAKCFRMPVEGVPVRHYFTGREWTVEPADDEYLCDANTVRKLGIWCGNNGRVVFLSHDGHTFVAKGYWVTRYLTAAGYKRGDLFVPFSNGEMILDPALAAVWNACPEEA